MTGIANALPAGSSVIFQNTTGTATLDLNGFNQTIDSLNKTTGGSGVVTSATPATLVLNGSASKEFNGSLAGAISLEKRGSGTVALSGTSTHTGSTRILDGTLLLSGSLTSNSSFELGESATLLASGSIKGPVTLNGRLSVDVQSTLSVDGPMTLGPASRTEVTIARSGDSVIASTIHVSGTLSLGGTLVIKDIGGRPLKAGDRLFAFDAASTFGGFSSVSLPPGYTLDPSQLAQGSAVIATVTPPPGFESFSVRNGTISLSWPATYKGWFLQSNSGDLAHQNWLDVIGSDAVTSVNLPMDPAIKREFF